jgi:hypothetical protein
MINEIGDDKLLITLPLSFSFSFNHTQHRICYDDNLGIKESEDDVKKYMLGK